MPLISENTQHMFVGGSSSQQTTVSGSSNCPVSCVFNCFDYLDGNQYDACHYYTEFEDEYGISPLSNGGVPTNCIAEIGAYEGFQVTEASNDDHLRVGEIAAFHADSIDHAVVITRFCLREDGKQMIMYHDPTTGDDDVIEMSNCLGL